MRCLRWIVFSLPLVAASSGMSAAEPAPEKLAARIERLIEQLDDNQFKVREAATAELLRIGVPAMPALRRAFAESSSAEVRCRARKLMDTIAPRYEGHSAGWHWIYRSISHGQSFQATDRNIESLELRVARLNAVPPAAPLEVEVRDPALKAIYGRGSIDSAQAGRAFAWRKVQWRHRAPLTAGQTYVMFFHSQDTSNKAPWLVNEIYSELYPDGTHLGYSSDFFFRLTFAGGRSIHVGPGEKTDLAVPISSGASGGTKSEGPLRLVGFGPVPVGKDAPADAKAPQPEKK